MSAFGDAATHIAAGILTDQKLGMFTRFDMAGQDEQNADKKHDPAQKQTALEGFFGLISMRHQIKRMYHNSPRANDLLLFMYNNMKSESLANIKVLISMENIFSMQ